MQYGKNCSRTNCKHHRSNLLRAPLFSCQRCIHNAMAIPPKRDNWEMKEAERKCFMWDCSSSIEFPKAEACRFCWHNPNAVYTNRKNFQKTIPGQGPVRCQSLQIDDHEEKAKLPSEQRQWHFG